MRFHCTPTRMVKMREEEKERKKECQTWEGI